MTAADLRAEIAAGPLKDELAPLVAATDDAAVAAALNRRDRPGYVPGRALVAALAAAGKWGLADRAVRHGTLPDGSACPAPLYDLFAPAFLAAYGTIDPPIRFAVAPLTAGVAQVVAAGLLDASVAAAVEAADVKISRAEELLGYGAEIDPAAVAQAR